MNDAGGMRFRKRISDLDGIFQCFIQAQPFAPDHLVQRFARHVFHGDELDPVRLGDGIVGLHVDHGVHGGRTLMATNRSR